MTNVNLEMLIAKSKIRKEKENPKTRFKHGLARTRVYNIYKKMKERCYSPTCDSYKYYGERGITICDEWLKDFTIFYKWAMTNGYTDDLSIDRKDVNGNYEPSNCKWATTKEQGNNRREHHYVTINDKTLTFAQWCDIYNTPPTTARRRIKWGWPEDIAITVPRTFTGRTLVLGIE